ncbi:hypothetical protein ACFQI7_29270 [Paenibacillus allorhizosphaerae]|uniref:LiaF transmembrane domain-containing protein n=1 Tax=Paenibacillus allorhizosphaerae TaxID=2849866 RepID=A0ABN7TTX3_9BACL|nr:hypothetical protein [Paenibacillus allorhizosphaerae]CAG7655678.1 hypothetical protein PAECIP111802_06180 [Paenibacillus allorhizosphaerae]
MTRWRVGTLSMGLTLVFLGSILFVSQMNGMKAFDAFIAWWPILFVLLGLEIILYIWFSRKENSVIHYDFISVFFVSVLYACCLGFAMLTSIGVIGEIRQAVSEVERTVELPDAQEPVGANIKRIIVQTSGSQVKVDQSTERTVHVFGSYRERVLKEAGTEADKPNPYAFKTVGDTMYVQIKQQPAHRGLRSYYPYMRVTVVLPQELQVEVRGADQMPIVS